MAERKNILRGLALLGMCASVAAPMPAQTNSQTNSQTSSQTSSQTNSQTSSPPPAGAAPAQAQKPRADPNAFPEAQSEAAEKEAEKADQSASDGPAATPNDAEPESSSRSRLKGVDVLGNRDARTSDGAGHVVNNPELAKQDVRVGQLYMGEGDFAGAYSRFKEATEVGPGNAEAVFYLAEAARKTAHLDEAATNYKLYLDAEPKGKHSKSALKALTELAGK